jgi:hypothetical protein
MNLYVEKPDSFPQVLLLVAIKSFSRGTHTGRADSVKVTAAGAVPKQISSQFKFTEGPAVNKKGDIYFTDQPNDKIWKYDTDGKLSLYMEKAGRSNGLYFDKKGNLISCADEKDELWSISPKGKITVLLTDYRRANDSMGPTICGLIRKAEFISPTRIISGITGNGKNRISKARKSIICPKGKKKLSLSMAI